jgi:hypothetical protein
MTKIKRYVPEMLDEHTLGHILSEMQDQEKDDGELDRAGWREILLEVGYPLAHVEQVLERWFASTPPPAKELAAAWMDDPDKMAIAITMAVEADGIGEVREALAAALAQYSIEVAKLTPVDSDTVLLDVLIEARGSGA